MKNILDYDIPSEIDINLKRIKIGKNRSQMKLAKEIREKCLPVYMEFSRDMVDTYSRGMNCIKTNSPEPLDDDSIDQETFQFIWPKLLYKMSENTKQLVLYIKNLPGFNQIDADDLAILFDKHS